MFDSKQVIVVYPEVYEDLAVTLQHEITKVDGFDCAAWTVEHYKQNMPTLSGRSYVIFVGAEDENKFSKMYLQQISSVVNVSGSCYGWDGSKAVVFGEGKLEQKNAFEEFKSKLGYGAASGAGATVGAIGAAVGGAFLVSVPLVPAVAFGGLGYQVVKYFKDKKEQKALRYEQTKIAIYNFVSAELDEWVKGGA